MATRLEAHERERVFVRAPGEIFVKQNGKLNFESKSNHDNNEKKIMISF